MAVAARSKLSAVYLNCLPVFRSRSILFHTLSLCDVMIFLKVHPTSPDLPCCCKVLTGDLSCQLLLPKFYLPGKPAWESLREEAALPPFLGCCHSGNYLAARYRSCFCDFDVRSPSPQAALGGVGLSLGWVAARVLRHKLRSDHALCPWPLPTCTPVTAGRGRASEVRWSPTRLGNLGY